MKVFPIVFAITCGIIGAVVGACIGWVSLAYIFGPLFIGGMGAFGFVVGAGLAGLAIAEEYDRRASACN